ncbi:MAG: hypothetical protein IPG60_16515 [Bacteroidetes bacterium]|nr:hypothetical protein [Bacteroidota bacterium]
MIKKFIKGAVDLFEEYYPESNHFFIQISRSEKFVEYKKLNYTNVTYSAFTRRKDINSILKFAKEKQVKNIFVHNLTPLKAAITSRIKKNTFAKTYWIFYGADLYGQLNALGKYDLLDSEEKPSKNQNDSFRSKLLFKYLFNSAPMKSYLYFIKQLDFFCFWNEYDYFLLKKHFKTSAIYKPFLYYGLIDRSHSIFDFNNCVDKVLINNSASANGNHATVLKKISELDGSDVLSEIITPLSYGNQEIKNSTLKYGYELFGVKFKPIKVFAY